MDFIPFNVSFKMVILHNHNGFATEINLSEFKKVHQPLNNYSDNSIGKPTPFPSTSDFLDVYSEHEGKTLRQ